MAPLARDHELEIGDPVWLDRRQSHARDKPAPVKVVRDMGRESGRDRQWLRGDRDADQTRSCGELAIKGRERCAQPLRQGEMERIWRPQGQ